MYNITPAEVPQLVHRAIVDQAVRHPGDVAVVTDGAIMTYGELLERAYSLAAALRSAGVRVGTTVASCLPRSPALAPTVLGIWLAGGTYVPVAPNSPVQRREYMLRDSDPSAIVTTEDLAVQLSDAPAKLVVVDRNGMVATRGSCPTVTGESAEICASDLAYIIYTSGSTGRPKGVLIEHGSLAAMANSHEQTLYGGRGRVVRHIAFNNVTTADSFFSDFVHLAFGRTLHIVDDETRRDPERLAQFIAAHSIEVLDATPTQIQTLALAGQAGVLSRLSVLIVGGEPTSAELWSLLSGLPNVAPYNLYGPTECTVAVTAAALRDFSLPMLGSSMPGCAVWVVDDELRQVPAEEEGELLITGVQVARGYLNPVQKDAARFVRFRLPEGGQTVRGYRTGDRGRRDRDGHLEFLGRIDDQISIGGYRVELGEIEAAMTECLGVRAAAVSSQRVGSEKTLVAYAVLEDGSSPQRLRDQLSAILPTYMIPVIAAVPRIPMGNTGKADFARIFELIDAGQDDPRSPASLVEDTRADLDLGIHGIWCEALGVSTVRPTDDFFALGGDSAKATMVVVAIREAIAPDVPIRVIFENPVFNEFCVAIGRCAGR